MKRRSNQKHFDDYDDYDYDSYRKVQEDRQRKETRNLKNSLRAKNIQAFYEHDEED